MADNENHPVRSGIIATVIGGLILAGLLYFIPQFYKFVLQLFGLFITAFANTWQYLLLNITVPNSIFWLLILLAIPTLIQIFQFFVKKKIKKSSEELSIRRYKQDKIFGLIWRWSSIKENNFPTRDIWCFCPQCSTRLISKERRLSYDTYLTHFICETCSFESQPFDRESADVLQMIGRQVERRVNTGEWKEIVKNEELTLGSNKS